ncbi:MAG: hypothetical protein QN183_03900 [Armatimonadota bacterium]|nr:hypothetical protein [Armatimonadota bacterium]MDR7535496.1 hypothetical protein [Armatimonadota bacterium]
MGGAAVPYRGQRGVSYLETVLVLALAGVVLGLSLPSYRNYQSNQRALAVARTLASDLRVAQQEALTRRADVDVTFAASDPACVDRPSYTIAQAAAVIKRYCFPADVEWSSLPAALAWDPTGIPQAGGTLRVRSSLTGKAYHICVAAQTGAITDDTRRPSDCG